MEYQDDLRKVMIDGDWQVAVEWEALPTTHIAHDAAMMFAADSVLYTITQALSTDLVERNGREDISIERCNAQIIRCPAAHLGSAPTL